VPIPDSMLLTHGHWNVRSCRRLPHLQLQGDAADGSPLDALHEVLWGRNVTMSESEWQSQFCI
jgi:hypothetical protein